MTDKTPKHAPQFCWVYEKGELDQGAFSISDPEMNKVAVILPADLSRPIEKGYNAMLMLRSYGSEDWRDAGIQDLGGAFAKGNMHAHEYRIQHQAALTLDQVKHEGLEMQAERGPKVRVASPEPAKGRER